MRARAGSLQQKHRPAIVGDEPASASSVRGGHMRLVSRSSNFGLLHCIEGILILGHRVGGVEIWPLGSDRGPP